jgi:hypothetical protein
MHLKIFSSALLFAGVASAQNAVPFPTNVEIDVIFPRNDTYSPVDVFPVVFAIQGATAAWDFGFHFDWDINYADGYANNGLVSSGYASGGAGLIDHERPPSDPFIVANKTVVFCNACGEHVFKLTWEFGFYTNCTQQGSTFEIESRRFNVRDSLYFTIKKGAKLPDITEPGSCPQLGSVLGLAGNSSSGCVHIGDSGIAANPCAIKVDQAFAASVTAGVGTTAPGLPSKTAPTTTPATKTTTGGGGTTGAGGPTGTGAAGRAEVNLAALLGVAALMV